MKSSEIKVGNLYLVKVGGRVVAVKVTGKFGWMAGKTFRDGWTATNTVTGRNLKIRSPQRLRGWADDHGEQGQ